MTLVDRIDHLRLHRWPQVARPPVIEEVRPVTLPPAAVLVVRRLRVESSASGAGQAVLAAVAEASTSAVRAARDPVPPDTEAVWFADEAELVACYLYDLGSGRRPWCWWYDHVEELHGVASPLALLASRPHLAPAALCELADRRALPWALGGPAAPAALALAGEMAAAHGAAIRSRAASARAQQLADRPPSTPVAPVGQVTTDVTAQRPEPCEVPAGIPRLARPPETLVGIRPGQQPVQLGQRTDPLGVLLAASRWLSRRPIEAIAGRSGTVRGDTAAPTSLRPRLPPSIGTAPASPGSTPQLVPSDGTRAGSASVSTPTASTDVVGGAADGPTSAGASRRPPRADSSDTAAPAADGSLTGPAQLRTAAHAVPEEGVWSRRAGALYLVNVYTALPLEETGLAGHDPWDVVDGLARTLAGGVDDDPLWGILAALSGRASSVPVGAGGALAEYRTPLDWLPPHEPLRAAERAGRLWVWCRAFVVAALVGRTVDALLGDRTADLEDPPPAGERPPTAVPGPDLSTSLAHAMGCLVPALRFRVGAPSGEQPLDESLTMPGRIWVTRTHLDVEFELDAISLAVRRCGLDQDPGWVPSLGRVVRFHYRSRSSNRTPP